MMQIETEAASSLPSTPTQNSTANAVYVNPPPSDWLRFLDCHNLQPVLAPPPPSRFLPLPRAAVSIQHSAFSNQLKQEGAKMTEKHKHTPGPWRVIQRTGQPRIMNERGNIIATINAFSENADVIAAAPDLLEACEAIIVTMETLFYGAMTGIQFTPEEIRESWQRFRVNDPTMKTINAAIAKAKPAACDGPELKADR